MKTSIGSYLIAGLPRCRLAWLSALLWSDELPCYHDDPARLNSLVERGTPFGFASASLITVDPEKAISVFADCPIVIVSRPAIESRVALAKWAGFPLPKWYVIEERFAYFVKQVPQNRLLMVESKSLDDYAVANRVYRHCRGLPLSEDKFRVFNLLKIEQHRQKVEEAHQWPS